MPSRTFLRLPQEKRQRILEAARLEFAEHSFESAKVTRICAQAGIPRVTFYSYFESLHDIYQCLYNELRCDTSEDRTIDACDQHFDDVEQQMQFFINLVRSRQGIRKMALDMRNEDPSVRLTWHLCISLALQYEAGVLSMEAFTKEYQALTALYPAPT